MASPSLLRSTPPLPTSPASSAPSTPPRSPTSCSSESAEFGLPGRTLTLAPSRSHVINGTVVYSTEITPTTNATSAAGETFTFMSGANGTYVKSGNSMSKIIRADIPIA